MYVKHLLAQLELQNTLTQKHVLLHTLVSFWTAYVPIYNIVGEALQAFDIYYYVVSIWAFLNSFLYFNSFNLFSAFDNLH